jgi:hypothetical protein
VYVFEPCLPTPFEICSLYFHAPPRVLESCTRFLVLAVSRLRQGVFCIEQGPLAIEDVNVQRADGSLTGLRGDYRAAQNRYLK